MKQIWVAESGEYEQRGVCMVGVSPQAIAKGLAERHYEYYRQHPEHLHCNGSIAIWGPMEQIGKDEFRIVCNHGSSRNETIYDITLYDFAE